MESVQFEFRPYRRPFRTPLMTAHGLWTVREGLIVRLSCPSSNQIGYGEIAPIAWFGSETLEQALAFCRQLPSWLTQADILAIPSNLPACQFGFESAWDSMQRSLTSLPESALPFSALLPAGESALNVWKSLYQAGDRTFKWKIAVAEVEQELAWFDQLCDVLPQDCKLRLDANGGLERSTAARWLERCDRYSNIEYLEQPLPPDRFEALLDLQSGYSTSIALDESVANLPQLTDCYQKGWQGIFVIKPAIAGSPLQLRQFFKANPVDAVFSSVFETAIGQQAGLALAVELANPQRAVGYGTRHWLLENVQEADALWQSL